MLSRFETISFSTLIIAQLFLNGFMLQVMNLIRYKNKSKLGKALTLTFSRSIKTWSKKVFEMSHTFIDF